MKHSSGVIIVDKPKGVTSHDVVAACRGLLHTKKVGHAGTLDPMATGVLVIGFGAATRLLNSLVGASKTYETTIRLGATSTTDDADGDITHTLEADVTTITREDIERAIAEHLTGDILQVPSTYSAKKVHGQRAYDLARNGQDVQLDANPVTIEDFTVTDVRCVDESESTYLDVDATVTCSAGTYIRALGRDLGELLHVGGYLTMLRRTRVGMFDADSQKTIRMTAQSYEFTQKDGEVVQRTKAQASKELKENEEELAEKVILPADAARAVLPVRELTAQQAVDICFGRPLKTSVKTLTAALYRGQLMALVEPWKPNLAKPSTVFMTAEELARLATQTA
ncbi:tRNA pseudouridine(55) synthase TruB [Alloscardovia macacae]|uniref:tRNA pseudouridine(55) synthase TruB n=1 Tax=Alloscardovia macacae TaxID=1160091 RepID=UPI00214D97C0|nr:tRNA pseudouridine(55) synthase TruB [Alloscardovia macacae]